MPFYSGPNRYLCDVLDEMRTQTRLISVWNMPRYRSSIKMLIEEAQTLAGRMEAAISDWSDIRRARDRIKELKKEISKLEKKKDSYETSDDS